MTAAAALIVEPMPARTSAPAASRTLVPTLDEESREWLRRLRAEGTTRDGAVGELHALLFRAARFEVARRRPSLPHLRGNDLDDIATRGRRRCRWSACSARLDDFRGLSRFTTWVYKFALLEAAVKLRKRAWQGREVPLEPESWELSSQAPSSGRTTPPSRASSCASCGSLIAERPHSASAPSSRRPGR